MSSGTRGDRALGVSLPAGYREEDSARWAAEAPKSAALPGAIEAAVGRSPFTRDRARVLHSGSFRRLAGKTQVVAPDEDAVPRTRLTHSLEVAQIAREIGEQLGCDADLVDLAGLAHDIGHPPFGHNGEAALDAAGAAAGGFEANAQNLRLLTRLEPKIIAPDGRPAGLNLTRASLDAVIKYPWPRPTAGGKFGVYLTEAEVFEWIRRPVVDGADPADPGGVVDRRCLEAQVMDWADDVAYSVHDVEDGVMLGRIDLRRLADPGERSAIAERAATYSVASPDDLGIVLADLLALPAVAGALDQDPGARGRAAIKRMTSELTGRLASGPIAATRERFGSGRLTRYVADLQVPAVLVAEVAVLKAIAVRYVMDDPVRVAAQHREQELLVELVRAMADRGSAALDPAFAADFDGAGGDAERLRAVLDQVSLLTDAQAVNRHRRWVAGIGGGSVAVDR